jgi:hypothetical protein
LSIDGLQPGWWKERSIIIRSEVPFKFKVVKWMTASLLLLVLVFALVGYLKASQRKYVEAITEKNIEVFAEEAMRRDKRLEIIEESVDKSLSELRLEKVPWSIREYQDGIAIQVGTRREIFKRFVSSMP